MKLGYSADQRLWLHVPREFPTPQFAGVAEWEADMTARYVQSRPQATPAEVATARAIARSALGGLAPEALFGVQFWPFPAPVAALLHVEFLPPLPGGMDPIVGLLGELPLALAPRVDPVSAPAIGDGVIVRFIAAQGDASSDASPLAGIGVLVSGPRCTVRILSDPTTTSMVGLLELPLRDLVASLRILDDDAD